MNAADIERQVRVTQANPKTLPACWFEHGVAERMAAWIERNVPRDRRLSFTYGDTTRR